MREGKRRAEAKVCRRVTGSFWTGHSDTGLKQEFRTSSRERLSGSTMLTALSPSTKLGTGPVEGSNDFELRISNLGLKASWGLPTSVIGHGSEVRVESG